MSANIAHASEKAHEETAQLRKKGIVQEAGLTQSNDLQACYESFLQREPKVDEGVVEVHWMLDKTGKISSMELVRTELDDQTFTYCILDKIKKMTFHAPPKARPTLVAHKFNFHKRSPASIDYK